MKAWRYGALHHKNVRLWLWYILRWPQHWSVVWISGQFAVKCCLCCHEFILLLCGEEQIDTSYVLQVSIRSLASWQFQLLYWHRGKLPLPLPSSYPFVLLVFAESSQNCWKLVVVAVLTGWHRSYAKSGKLVQLHRTGKGDYSSILQGHRQQT